MSLRDACSLLDVNDTTLRQWADGGYLRVYRTPVGHRRFLRQDVESFVGGQMSDRGVTATETVEAFVFFRSMVLDSANQASWTRILQTADQVLVGVVGSYQDAGKVR